MDNENYIITVCPSCACRYRVPEAILGLTVSCKKCGTGFSLGSADESTQKQKRFEKIISTEQKSSDVPDGKERAKTDAEFNLTVSEDKLNAFISVNGKGSGTITLDTIKNFLQMKGIEYGIVDDAKIAEYLKIFL
jgi:predicted Zn finger-like uncharacterized protein